MAFKHRAGLFLVLAVWAFTPARPAWPGDLNWIANGDFKHPGGAQGWVGSLNLQPGRQGEPAVYLENLKPVWNEVSQKVPMPDPAPAAIEISGWMRTQNVVQGEQVWNAARISVVFYDAKGDRLGDWPPTTAQVTGTHDWTLYSHTYPLAPGTAWATVELSLGDCTGRAWFSGLKCLAYDFNDQPLASGQAAHPGLKPPPPAPGPNWILDPGFEDLASRDWNGGQTVPTGRGSGHSRYVENQQAAWTLAQQDVSFRGKTPVSVVYGGWLKTEGVQLGTENYMTARLGIDFRDASGKQVGGWQDSVCKVTGTTAWTHYERAYPVPAGTASAHLDAGLGNCVGKAWVDDLSLELIDAQGAPMTVQLTDRQVSDTSDWYAFQPPTGPSDTTLDLSFLNDKPAGAHG
ncbi:MAG TPA: hypothetical protein VFR02_06560, partial [bacterium]|nr:hypothetical protein [bacterium]